MFINIVVCGEKLEEEGGGEGGGERGGGGWRERSGRWVRRRLEGEEGEKGEEEG